MALRWKSEYSPTRFRDVVEVDAPSSTDRIRNDDRIRQCRFVNVVVAVAERRHTASRCIATESFDSTTFPLESNRKLERRRDSLRFFNILFAICSIFFRITAVATLLLFNDTYCLVENLRFFFCEN